MHIALIIILINNQARINNQAAISATRKGGSYYISVYKQFSLLNLSWAQMFVTRQQQCQHCKSEKVKILTVSALIHSPLTQWLD